jgi:hypothetical protein
MPAPNDPSPKAVDRKAAMAVKDLLETPAQARMRVAKGEPAPGLYRPTPPRENAEVETAGAPANPYK